MSSIQTQEGLEGLDGGLPLLQVQIVQMYHEETDLLARSIIARQLLDRSPPLNIRDLLCPFGPGPRVFEGEEPLFF